VALSIVEKEGWPALWKGNTATMMRVFPYSGIQFMVFDYCKVYFLGEQKRRKGSGYRDVAGGPTMATTGHRGAIAKKGTIPHGGGGEKKGGLTPGESLISGMIAGTISVLFTYPLDLARAQLAVLRKTKKSKAVGTAVQLSQLDGQLGIGSTRKSNKGIGYVLNTSYQQGGARGLYRGITPTILGILPYSGVAFTINEQAKRQITHIMQRDPTTIERLQCGALSGLFAQTLAYPLEVTRRRMQTIGIVPTSGSESAAVNFTGVSQLKPSMDELPNQVEATTTTQQQQQPTRATPRLNISGNSVSGNGESVAQSIISNINNNTTTATTTTQQQHQYHKPPSMSTTMKHLFEEQGLRGFYKGVSMNWVKGPIAFSLSFTAFDTIQGWIENDVEREERRRRSHQFEDVSSRMNIQRRLTNNED